jgi:two-component system, cell cycle sensor histidine kinase and response regulator CckA
MSASAANSTSTPTSTEGHALAARLFRDLTWLSIGIGTLAPIVLSVLLPGHLLRWLMIAAVVDGLSIALLFLNRRGYPRLSSVLLIGLLIVPPTISSMNAGGIHGPAVMIYFVAIVMSGILLGDTGSLGTAIVCSLAGLGLVLLELRGWLPANSAGHTSVSVWASVSIWSFCLVGIQKVATGVIQGALSRAQAELDERKRAETRLMATTEQLQDALAAAAHREAEFRAIFDNATFGVALTNRQGRVIRYNQAFAAFLGYPLAELMQVERRDYTHPDDRDASEERSRAFLKGEITEYRMEKRYIRKDGETVWGRLMGCRIGDSGGADAFGMAILEDITARKKAEEDRLALEAKLMQAQKIEAIGHLAGGVAHDFNNLLTVIDGYSQIVLRSLGEKDPSRPMIVEMRKATERAAGLTRQLLAFSRKTVLAPRILDLNDLVINLEKMLRRLIGEDVRLTTVLAPRLGLVKADPGLLEQAILNLSINARDAMPLGGRLTIETGMVDLDPAYCAQQTDVQPGRYILLAVSDTGHGIAKDIQEHLFEPFFTTKQVGQGTGLGLAMVYGFVKQSGGHVTVYSEPGHGATFKLYLPHILQEADAASQDARRMDEPLKGGTETILVVEDEDGVRNLIKSVLESCGYEVLEAANGRLAVELARSRTQSIGMLVTDVVMPEMTGAQTAEAIRAIHPGIKVLFLSGYTDDAVVRHGVLEHNVEFLQKPFSPDRLTSKVREVLDSNGRS